MYPLNEGTLNYYKIFVEEIISSSTNQTSIIGLLIPRTILNDRHSEKLRSRIFEHYELSTIYTIPEKNGFFPDVAQAFCFFAIDKSRKGKQFSIVDDVKCENDFGQFPVSVSIFPLKRNIFIRFNHGIKRWHANTGEIT